MIKKIVVLFTLALILSSCVSKKEIVYFQNISSSNLSEVVKYEPCFKPDDLLMIIVSAPDAEAAIPFNLSTVGVMGANSNTSLDVANAQLRYQTYLVNNDGVIFFPVIGAIKIGGLTRTQAMEKMLTELKKYINNPVVNIRILNYKVSVIGEVVRPGSFDIETERITLPEALSKAGDMTIYGNRKHVLVVREVDGKKTYNFVDMTQADFFNSPFYFLTQNDLVVVEPNKTKINSSAVGPNITVAISLLSLVITVISIATR
jgi:polysaccharide export outer membrane protein